MKFLSERVATVPLVVDPECAEVSATMSEDFGFHFEVGHLRKVMVRAGPCPRDIEVFEMSAVSLIHFVLPQVISHVAFAADS